MGVAPPQPQQMACFMLQRRLRHSSLITLDALHDQRYLSRAAGPTESDQLVGGTNRDPQYQTAAAAATPLIIILMPAERQVAGFE